MCKLLYVCEWECVEVAVCGGPGVCGKFVVREGNPLGGVAV